jgi:hypothetical protein
MIVCHDIVNYIQKMVNFLQSRCQQFFSFQNKSFVFHKQIFRLMKAQVLPRERIKGCTLRKFL